MSHMENGFFTLISATLSDTIFYQIENKGCNPNIPNLKPEQLLLNSHFPKSCFNCSCKNKDKFDYDTFKENSISSIEKLNGKMMSPITKKDKNL